MQIATNSQLQLAAQNGGWACEAQERRPNTTLWPLPRILRRLIFRLQDLSGPSACHLKTASIALENKTTICADSFSSFSFL